MRIKLHKLGSDERYHFTATFERFGQKPAYRSSTPDKTVLLKDVKCDGDFVADISGLIILKDFRNYI